MYGAGLCTRKIGQLLRDMICAGWSQPEGSGVDLYDGEGERGGDGDWGEIWRVRNGRDRCSGGDRRSGILFEKATACSFFFLAK